MKQVGLLFCAFAACVLAALPASAGTHTWSGVVSGLWSDSGNWSAGGAPVDGESVDLVFPTAQGHMGTLSNDLNNLTITSITFSDTAYTVGGNPVSLAGTITVDAGGTLFGVAHFGLAAALTADATLVSTDGRFLSMTGAIGGAFGLTTQNGAGGTHPGEVMLVTANSYSGITHVLSGYLVMGNAQALGAADGTAATGTVVSSGATLVIFGTVANEALTIGGGGASGNGAFQVANTADWTGPITLTSQASTNILSSSLTLSGPISGPGFGIDFQAPAGVTLTGTNTYNGTDRMFSGVVTINGTNAATFQTNYFGSGGGTLRGTGTVAGISAGGASATANVVAPGTPAATGTLTSTGTLLLDVNSTLQARIGGPNDGIDSDQVFLPFGGSTLSNAPVLALSVINGYSVPLGATYTLINNGEGAATTGTFAGLPEGAIFTATSQNFQITYVGGPLSNNVVVTRVAGTPVELQRFGAE